MTPAVCREMDGQLALYPHEAGLVKDLYRVQSVLATKMPVEFALEAAILEKEEARAKLFAKGLEYGEQSAAIEKLQLAGRRV